jgi:hypothetical protein
MENFVVEETSAIEEMVEHAERRIDGTSSVGEEGA